MLPFFRHCAARLPAAWQQELRRFNCRRKIRNGSFVTDEPEYALLDSLLSPGDWVIDVGANVGHYTKRFSELVGSKGRVIALEPVPETFALLSANMQLLACSNVSLFNVAVSEKNAVVGMTVPTYDDGITNYYQAHLVAGNETAFAVLALSLDSFAFPHPLSLIKIDAEGHEHAILKGMRGLLERDHPALIIETDSGAVADFLGQFGYACRRMAGSPNQVFQVPRQ